MIPTLKRFLPAALWLVVIFILTSLPAPVIPDVRIPHADKMIHFAIYLPLGFLLARAFRHRGSRAILYAAALCLAAASCDELHQVLVPGRSADILDLLADLAGGLAGAGLWLATKRTRQARPPE
jgi:VanZ family protein